MQADPKTLLRGLAKLVAVVVLAGLVGAGLGVVLAKLSGNDGGGPSALSPAAGVTAKTASATTTTATATAATTTIDATRPPVRTTTAAAETSPPSAATSRAPRVQVLLAQLGPVRPRTRRALVAVKLRVSNRGARPLRSEAPVLLSGKDEVRVSPSAGGAPNPLLRTLAPGAGATGTLRFTLPSAVAARLQAEPTARLRIATRTITLTLAKGGRP